ncbi:MAG: MAPEG family protein [Gammaproteobacteria bacterium]
MKQHLIFWPVLLQVLIPVIVLFINGKRKSTDVKAGTVDRVKAAMDNEAWSVPVVLTSKNLANQFQLPVLFYVVCLVLFNLGSVTAFTLGAACLFVASRYLHAYVHVTSNYVPLRMRSFIFGVLVLLALIVMTAVALLRA